MAARQPFWKDYEDTLEDEVVIACCESARTSALCRWNLKTKVSVWKRMISSPSKLRSGNLKITQHAPSVVILDLCFGKNWSENFNKLTSVFHASVLLLIMNCQIVKVAVDPRGDSRVDSQTTLTMLWRHSLSITEQTLKKLTSICFLR